MYLNCQGCNKELNEEKYTMVAKWPFCQECFQKLMEKPKNKIPPKESISTGDESDKAKPVIEKTCCQICKKEVTDEESKRVGICIFCSGCYADFNTYPKVHDNKNGSEEDIDLDVPKGRIQVKIDHMASVRCDSCGRKIPERGSKKVDDKPF
jgi:uncharacterized CHY-type Zn-finger protein